MSYYAFLDENNKVTEVITGRAADEVVEGISDWESHYGEIRGQRCKRTSINAAEDGFRKNYAGLGYSYDEKLDAFVAPQPYPSWILNSKSAQWEAPTPKPNDGKIYGWFEGNREWIELKENSAIPVK
jgi:hypothetical protein